ncbi:MAG: hypothetical protein K2R98_09905 [Gemmataceae bacterium]|nr:hypothetical protein [Gemmataceae bacterium]
MRASISFPGIMSACVFLASGCGSSGDPGTAEIIAGYSEAIEAMKSMTDEASSVAATSKLRAASAKIRSGVDKMQEPTPDQKKQLEDLFKQYTEQATRITKVPIKASGSFAGMLDVGAAVGLSQQKLRKK